MSILVIGATGQIGRQVVGELARRGADVRAMGRDPGRESFPEGVAPVKADLLDPESLRAAFAGVRTVFVLCAVSPDELTRTLLSFALAREAGIERFVYFSMLRADVFWDTPHASSKYAVELMLERYGVAATILRPSYFMQNDAAFKEAILTHGVYPMPIGGVGAAMVDIRDIAEVAALELLRRDRAERPLPSLMLELPGPEAFTGESMAALWSEAAGRPVRYAGDDLKAFEAGYAAQVPAWMACDIALMFGGFQSQGMLGKPGAAGFIEKLLGRPLRTYRDFSAEMLREWGKG